MITRHHYEDSIFTKSINFINEYSPSFKHFVLLVFINVNKVNDCP